MKKVCLLLNGKKLLCLKLGPIIVQKTTKLLIVELRIHHFCVIVYFWCGEIYKLFDLAELPNEFEEKLKLEDNSNIYGSPYLHM